MFDMCSFKVCQFFKSKKTPTLTVIVLKDNLQKNINPLKGSMKPNWEGFLMFDFFDSDILYYAQSDIFDKSKVILKLTF